MKKHPRILFFRSLQLDKIFEYFLYDRPKVIREQAVCEPIRDGFHLVRLGTDQNIQLHLLSKLTLPNSYNLITKSASICLFPSLFGDYYSVYLKDLHESVYLC